MLVEGPISWSTKKKSSIELSSTEAEYRRVVNATTQCLWLQGILGECGFESQFSTIIYCDNQRTFESEMIQFRYREPNTLISICTTSDSLCMMAPFTYSSVHLQNKQQIFSPKFFVRRKYFQILFYSPCLREDFSHWVFASFLG